MSRPRNTFLIRTLLDCSVFSTDGTGIESMARIVPIFDRGKFEHIGGTHKRASK